VSARDRGLPAPSLAANARTLIAGLRAAGVKRVLYVGGASSLEVAPGKVLADQPDFPEASKAEAREGRGSLAVWRNEAEGRVAVLDAIRVERVATIAAIDSITRRSIAQTGAMLNRLLLWTVLAFLALGGLALCGVLLLRRRAPG